MTSRLLTLAQVAEYLNIPKTAVKSIPRGVVTICGRVRWDRVALDAWLNEVAGCAAPEAPREEQTPDEALAAWIADENAHARTA